MKPDKAMVETVEAVADACCNRPNRPTHSKAKLAMESAMACQRQKDLAQLAAVPLILFARAVHEEEAEDCPKDKRDVGSTSACTVVP